MARSTSHPPWLHASLFDRTEPGLPERRARGQFGRHLKVRLPTCFRALQNAEDEPLVLELEVIVDAQRKVRRSVLATRQTGPRTETPDVHHDVVKCQMVAGGRTGNLARVRTHGGTRRSWTLSTMFGMLERASKSICAQGAARTQSPARGTRRRGRRPVGLRRRDGGRG